MKNILTKKNVLIFVAGLMVVIFVPLIYFSVFNEQPTETNPVSESNIEETENKFLCEYLGKTAFDVKKDFGDNYELSALAGSSVMNYQSEKNNIHFGWFL